MMQDSPKDMQWVYIIGLLLQ